MLHKNKIKNFGVIQMPVSPSLETLLKSDCSLLTFDILIMNFEEIVYFK